MIAQMHWTRSTFTTLYTMQRTICIRLPSCSKGFIRTAEVYLKLNDLDKSKEYFKKALKFDCDNIELKRSLELVEELLRQSYSKDYSIAKILMPECRNVNETSFLDVRLGHEYKRRSDITLAAFYFAKASNQNNAEGLYNLSLLHTQNPEMKPDFQASLNFLNQTAFDSLNMHVEINMIASVYWYYRGLEYKQPNTAYKLGLNYLYANGVSQDFDTAESMFLQAHELGNNEAGTRLVQLYILKDNIDQALYWHEQFSTDEIFSALKNYIIEGHGLSQKILWDYTKRGSLTAKRLLKAHFLLFTAVTSCAFSNVRPKNICWTSRSKF